MAVSWHHFTWWPACAICHTHLHFLEIVVRSVIINCVSGGVLRLVRLILLRHNLYFEVAIYTYWLYCYINLCVEILTKKLHIFFFFDANQCNNIADIWLQDYLHKLAPSCMVYTMVTVKMRTYISITEEANQELKVSHKEFDMSYVFIIVTTRCEFAFMQYISTSLLLQIWRNICMKWNVKRKEEQITVDCRQRWQSKSWLRSRRVFQSVKKLWPHYIIWKTWTETFHCKIRGRVVSMDGTDLINVFFIFHYFQFQQLQHCLFPVNR